MYRYFVYEILHSPMIIIT